MVEVKAMGLILDREELFRLNQKRLNVTNGIGAAF